METLRIGPGVPGRSRRRLALEALAARLAAGLAVGLGIGLGITAWVAAASMIN